MTRKVLLLPPESVDRLQRYRDAVKALVQSVKDSDVQRFLDTLIEHHCAGYEVLRPAFKRIARLSQPSRDFQTAIVHLVAEWGDSLRCELGDDLLLCDALRALLPPYQGAAPLRLYRGETAHNRQRRTYGASWSRNRELANSFAQDWFQRTCEGGSVLLERMRPAPRSSL